MSKRKPVRFSRQDADAEKAFVRSVFDGVIDYSDIPHPDEGWTKEQLAAWAIRKSVECLRQLSSRYLVHVLDMDSLHFNIEARAQALRNTIDSTPHFTFLKGYEEDDLFAWSAFHGRPYRTKLKGTRKGTTPSTRKALNTYDRSWDGLLNEDSWEAQGFPPCSELNLASGSYPSVYHLYAAIQFLVTVGLGVLGEGYCEHDSLKDLEVLPGEYDYDSYVESTSYLNLLLTDPEILASLPELATPHSISFAFTDGRYTGCDKYREVTCTTVGSSPNGVIAIPVEAILGGAGSEHKHRELVTKRSYPTPPDREDFTKADFPFRQQLGVLIEGIHFNRHRLPEISHLVVRSKETRAQALERIRSKSYPTEIGGVSRYAARGDHLFFDLDSEEHPEIVVVEDLILAGTSIDSISCMDEWSKQFVVPESIKEARALDSMLDGLRARLARISDQENECFLELMRYQAQRKAAETELRELSQGIRAIAENLCAELMKMGVFTHVQFIGGFHVALQTEDLWAHAEHGQGKVYVGRYQILVHPFSGFISLRNLNAPISIALQSATRSLLANPGASRRIIRGDASLQAVIHPHSASGRAPSSGICLGGYAQQISVGSVGDDESQQSAVIRRVKAVLRFLQNYNSSDSFVLRWKHVMTEEMPKNTAVTTWQEIHPAQDGECASLPVELFGISSQECFSPEDLDLNKARGIHFEWDVFNVDDYYAAVGGKS